LGRDPVAFIGGAGVTVKGLTQAQLIDAYTGKVINWKELGGKPLPIRAVGREASDTLRISIARVVKPFENITFGEGVKTVSFDPQIVELMDRFPGSLGFLNRSGLGRAKTKLVVLDLDGVTPNAQNVAAGRYGIWVDFGLIHKTGALSPGAKAFVDFTRSSEGLRILKEHGVLAPVEQR
jgi:phosphate transport system substrate-binding protein